MVLKLHRLNDNHDARVLRCRVAEQGRRRFSESAGGGARQVGTVALRTTQIKRWLLLLSTVANSLTCFARRDEVVPKEMYKNDDGGFLPSHSRHTEKV
jgi:hypothetical protein